MRSLYEICVKASQKYEICYLIRNTSRIYSMYKHHAAWKRNYFCDIQL